LIKRRSGTEFKFVIDKIQRLNTESKVVINLTKVHLMPKEAVEYTIAAKEILRS
jgi:hypothetical protein